MATMTDVTCPCGTVFQARTADVNRGWGKFCSKSCKTTFAKSTPAPVCSNCHGSGQDPGLPFLDCEVCNVFAAPMVSMSAPEQPIDDGGQAGPSFEQLGQHLCSDQACECGGTGVIDAKGDKLEAALVREATLIANANQHKLAIDAACGEIELLQQRLTVAEQRAGDLEHSLMWVRSQLTDARVIFHIDAMLKPATERPVMHPGKPPIGSVVTVHGSIKAIVIAHHAEGIVAGAGEGHLVKEGSYKP